MVFKVEKSVFKNAVAVYFQNTRKRSLIIITRDTCVCVYARAPAERGAGEGSRGAAWDHTARRWSRTRQMQFFRKVAPCSEGLRPYRHQFILAGFARANKQNPRPLAGFLFFCMPVRYRYGGEKGLFFGRSRADLPPHGRFPAAKPAAPRRDPAPGLPRPPLCVVLEVPPARIRATGMKKERQNAVLPRFWLQNTKKCDRI